MATKVLLTAEEYAALPSCDTTELVRGEVVELVPASFRHGVIVSEAVWLLTDWTRRTGAGQIASGDSGFVLGRAPDTVRGPDVAFIRKDRIAEAVAHQPWPEFGPDFVIEVRSPSNTWREIREKIVQFFAAGTRLALVLEADRHFAEVHRPGQDPLRLELDDRFSAEDVLPGFGCKIADFFPKP